MEATPTPSILLIYTGGTIGMVENPETGALESFDFAHLVQHVPELKRLGYRLKVRTFDPPIDSSDMEPEHWARLVKIISSEYLHFDGFVVLHGTDTMAYTASALSFMLENLDKPVIFTGSQLPIGMLRTDGKENLVTAIQIAAARNAQGRPMVPEVCIFFENRLMRGNRTTKINAEGFNAFRSFNYPPLAHVGVHIVYDEHLIHRPQGGMPLKPHFTMSRDVVILTLFPGIRREYVTTIMRMEGLKAVILKTYGAGNAPQKQWLIDLIQERSRMGVIFVNITQCSQGTVEMNRYQTGRQLLNAGVINGHDSTPECMVTKLMFLLGMDYEPEVIKHLMNRSIAGEITT